MHGNVWEWCEDNLHDNYEGAPTDGTSWLSGISNEKVIRGGSWVVNPSVCRSACRTDNGRGVRYDDIGFRVVVARLANDHSFVARTASPPDCLTEVLES